MALFPADSDSWSPGDPLPRPLENGGPSWDNPQTQLLHGVVKSWTRLSDSTTIALPRDKVLSSESQLEAEIEAGAGCLRGVSTDTSSLANGVTAGVCVCVCGLDHSQKAASGSLRQSAFTWPFQRFFPAGRASAGSRVCSGSSCHHTSVPRKEACTSCPRG